MFENDVLNNILKPPLPPPGTFFYGGFNPPRDYFFGTARSVLNRNIIDLVNIFSKYVLSNE